MKKVLSMVLTVALIATTLAGLFVMDASAATSAATGSGADRVVTATWGTGTAGPMGGVGTYVFKNGTTEETYEVATVTDETVLGKDLRKMTVNAVTMTLPMTSSNQYVRATPQGDSLSNNLFSAKMTEADFKAAFIDEETASTDNVLHITYYAYTKGTTGNGNVVSLTVGDSQTTTIEFKPEMLYSAADVPHRIDVIAYVTSTSKFVLAGDVDGRQVVRKSIDASSASTNNAIKKLHDASETNGTVMFTSFINIGPGSNNTSNNPTGTIELTEQTYYIGAPEGAAVIADTLKTRAQVEAELAGYKPTWADPAETTPVSGFVTGVSAEAQTALEAALKNMANGDRTIDIEGVYLSDIITDAAQSNVTAVDRTTGAAIDTAVYGITEINDTYLLIKGIYVIPAAVAPSGIKPAYRESFENAENGSVLSFLDAYYVSDLFNEGYESVTVSGEALTVSYDGDTYTNLAALTEAPLNDVTFTCGAKTFTAVTYEDSGVQPFVLGLDITDGAISARIRREDYTSKAAALAVGGLTSGFYKYTSEPRGIIAFDKGISMYNRDAGYYQLGSYGNASAEKSPYVTLAFTAYIPEYTYVSNSAYRIVSYLSSASQNFAAYLVTREADVAYNRFLVPGNAWSNIRMEYDFTEVASTGKVSCDYYINDVYAGTLSQTDASFTGRNQNFYAIRFYMPFYSSLTVMDDSKWYYGRTGSAASMDVSAAEISGGIEGVTVDEANSRLVTSLDEEALIAAMEGYEPVYVYEYASKDDMDAAFDEVDGTITTTDTYTHSGALIKKWLLAAGFMDESGNKTSTCPNGITSITMDGDSATMTLASTYGHTTYYDGICTSVADLLELYPALRTETLVGFAVSEEGKLPRIYSLAQEGVELQRLAVNSTGLGTLYFAKYGSTTVDGKLLVASYGQSDEVLKVNILDITAPISEAATGEQTVTLQADSTADVKYYKAFLFDSIDSIKPLLPSAQMSASN